MLSTLEMCWAVRHGSRTCMIGISDAEAKIHSDITGVTSCA
jgi:hypothetical protein